MLGVIILGILILLEIGFTISGLMKKSNLKREKAYVSIASFALFLILVISPVINWGFQWTMLGLFLGIQALLGILVIVRGKQNSGLNTGKAIFKCLSRTFLIVMLVFPSLIFPQYDPINPTGEYAVGTKSYTLTDESREEYFTEEKDNRKVTVQLWYPSDLSAQEEAIAQGKFPLVIFSHGAFGYRMSNYSTYQELASHGYIVASIDHTYHAFMTKQEDGKTITADMKFMNDAMMAQNGAVEAEEMYNMEQEWMKLRTEDMAFVLDYIKETAMSVDADAVYKSMDLEHIGVFGHSLGGATSAQIGREDAAVDAVIVLDGTMLGEITGFENGKEVVSDVPFPKPIMNIYNESHYADAVKLQEQYPNIAAYRNAPEAYQVVVKGSGHMSFTDLAIISPFLSNMLETSKLGAEAVDARYCIETTNNVILQFFDRYLKSSNVEIAKERFF
ncbi:MAG: platelet-activating factor acetylhydrolase, plasma/intracellular isoform [Clostridia bacterium]|jgi:dienelactone hydrolase|nr:platelet-activating factor acetylhydrolase, plasma/intracellular isoform [Clostridia bacterium]